MSDGKLDELKGRANEAVGDVTDDDDVTSEGNVDKAGGSIKDKVDKVVAKIKDVVSRRR